MKKIVKILMFVFMFLTLMPFVANAASKYDVTIKVTHDDRALANATVMVSQGRDTISYIVTDSNGIATIKLENGYYSATVGYVDSAGSYYGRTTFRVNSAAANVQIAVDIDFTMDEAIEVYNETSYFNHLDIRVNGSLKTNEEVHAIKIKNVKIEVKNGDKTIIKPEDYTFNDSETYEWRITRIAIPNNLNVVVSLVFDIYVDDVLVRDNYVYSFSGYDDFIRAIINCDQNQGLDFAIDAQEIIEAAHYNVSYTWDLPEGLADVPVSTNNYSKDDNHLVDTEWTAGEQLIDEKNGKLYTFLGWEEYSVYDETNESYGEKEPIVNNSITIENDTVVYGKWEVTQLESVTAHLELTKTFSGSVRPENLYFIVEENKINGHKYVVPYSNFENGKYLLPVTEGQYIVTEYDASIKGYSLSTVITSTLQSSDVTSNSITVSVPNLGYITPGSSNEIETVGTVAFVNTYTKKVSNDVIYNYPNLVIEKTDTLGNALIGATFTLTNVATGQDILSLETNESGYTEFKHLEVGTYKLVETKAPAGHIKAETIYDVVVLVDNASEMESYDPITDSYVKSYNLKVEVTINSNPADYFNASIPRLTVFNERMTGSLTINKIFAANSDINKDNFNGDIKVKVTGNDYANEVVLSKSNGWTATLDGLYLGSYTIEEVSADVKGYDLVTNYSNNTIEISENNLYSNVIITNTYSKKTKDVMNNASFNLKKENKNETALEGATFGLYDSEDRLVQKLTTNEEGIITFGEFDRAGEYILKEIEAPTDYVKTDKTWKVIVALKDNKIIEEYDESSNTYNRIFNWEVTIDDERFVNSVLTVINNKKTGSVTVNKIVEFTLDGQNVTKPDDSYDNIEYKFIISINGQEESFTLKAGESKTFDNIEYGWTYQVKEIVPEDASFVVGLTENSTGIVNFDETKVEVYNTYELKGEGVVEQPNNPEDDNDKDDTDEDIVITPGDDFNNDDENKPENDNPDNIPNTGVASNLTNYIVSLMISILGLAISLAYKRRIN